MRRHVPALSLLGSLIFLPTCASTNKEDATVPEPAVTGPQLDRATEVVHLRHADATETAAIVNNLITSAGGRDDDELRVAPDARRNAVIVSGTSRLRARVVELLGSLDVPPR